MLKRIFAIIGMTVILILYIHLMRTVALPEIYAGPFSYYVWLILCIIGVVAYVLFLIVIIVKR